MCKRWNHQRNGTDTSALCSDASVGHRRSSLNMRRGAENREEGCQAKSLWDDAGQQSARDDQASQYGVARKLIPVPNASLRTRTPSNKGPIWQKGLKEKTHLKNRGYGPTPNSSSSVWVCDVSASLQIVVAKGAIERRKRR